METNCKKCGTTLLNVDGVCPDCVPEGHGWGYCWHDCQGCGQLIHGCEDTHVCPADEDDDDDFDYTVTNAESRTVDDYKPPPLCSICGALKRPHKTVCDACAGKARDQIIARRVRQRAI